MSKLDESLCLKVGTQLNVLVFLRRKTRGRLGDWTVVNWVIGIKVMFVLRKEELKRLIGWRRKLGRTEGMRREGKGSRGE